MITNMSEADDAMAALFRQSWEVTAGYVCDWPNHKANEHHDQDIWARWTLDYVDGRQASLVGAGRQRKFIKEGLIYVSVFTPLGAGLKNARNASQIALFTYEGKKTTNDVWFRDVRIESEGHGRGSGKEKSWWTTLVVARFTYEHLR